MPELPEVETTRRGLAPLVTGQRIEALIVRNPRLRWPIRPSLAAALAGQRIEALGRRAKYLLLTTTGGTLLIHLGMSGSLRYLGESTTPLAHDHVDLVLAGGASLRFNDPRRFGSFQLTQDPALHPLLRDLGPEPLGEEFTASLLRERCAGRRVAIKQRLMDGHAVVGVGNIYASEALYLAGIHPSRPAGRISMPRVERLVDSIRQVLREAVEQGGTTLRNYVDGHGRPGYFKLKLAVYDRAGQPCRACGTAIRLCVLGQRATYYCPRCQR
jgi:formamidopyrimidine-DNA glycosylase